MLCGCPGNRPCAFNVSKKMDYCCCYGHFWKFAYINILNFLKSSFKICVNFYLEVKRRKKNSLGVTGIHCLCAFPSLIVYKVGLTFILQMRSGNYKMPFFFIIPRYVCESNPVFSDPKISVSAFPYATQVTIVNQER